MLHARPSPPGPRLVAIARAAAWKSFFVALGCIVGGVLMTALGLALFLFIPFGVVMLVTGVVMLPISLWRVIDPTRHEALRGLGRTPLERAAAIQHIEWELGHPQAWRIGMTSGALVVTPTWLVHHSSASLVIVGRSDLVWYWETVQRGRYGGASHFLSLHSRRCPDPHKIPMKAGPDHHVWAALAHACPFALSGYQMKDVPLHAIAAEVDRRRYLAQHR